MYLKPTYNQDMNSTRNFTQIAPSPRYGHAAVFVQKLVSEYYPLIEANITTKKKYMYVYGGVAYDCIDGCDDFWVYEIPWASQRYFLEPESTNEWWNRGGSWYKENFYYSSDRSPGKRYFHNMVADYEMETVDDVATEEQIQKFIYLYGGMHEDIIFDDIW